MSEGSSGTSNFFETMAKNDEKILYGTIFFGSENFFCGNRFKMAQNVKITEKNLKKIFLSNYFVQKWGKTSFLAIYSAKNSKCRKIDFLQKCCLF